MNALLGLLRSLRPHQWTKNLVLLAALGFSKHLFDAGLLVRALLAMAVFCVLSGAVYLINDLADVERDRLHPRKRLRPIASGQIGAGLATVAAVVLALGGLAAGFALGQAFGICSLVYLGMNLAYSFKLKNVVILDVLVLSSGFVVRAVAGGLVIGVDISHWLLICTLLFALFLSLSKRRHELVFLSDGAAEHRSILAEYSPYLLDQMIAVVTASCVMAYTLYTMAAETRVKLQTDRLVWTVPFVLYGIFRYLYLVHRKEQGGSPTDVLLTDRPLLINVGLWALAVVAILYTAGGLPVPIGS